MSIPSSDGPMEMDSTNRFEDTDTETTDKVCTVSSDRQRYKPSGVSITNTRPVTTASTITTTGKLPIFGLGRGRGIFAKTEINKTSS